MPVQIPAFMHSTRTLVEYFETLKNKYDTLVIYSQANLAFSAKKYEEAEKLYVEAIGKGDKESLIGLGTLYRETKRYSDAIKVMLALWELGDHSDNVLMEIGNTFEIEKNYDEEIKFFAQILHEDNNARISHAFIGNAYYYKLETAKARVNYEDAINNGYNFIAPKLLDIYISINEINEAKKLVETLNKSGYKVSNYDIGRVYFEAKQWVEAKKYLLKCDLHDINVLDKLGTLSTYTKSVEEAQRFYDELFKLSQEPRFLQTYSYFMYEMKKYDRAAPYLLILSQKHKDIKALNMLATIYEMQNNFDEANKLYLEAIVQGNVNSLYNIGLMHLKAQKIDLAKRYLTEGSNKGVAEASLLLSQVFLEESDNRNSLKYSLAAIQQDIDPAKIVDTKFRIATLYAVLGEIPKAIDFLEQIQENDVTSRFLLGNIYTDQKKYELAKQYFLSVDPTQIDDPDHLYWINFSKVLIKQRFFEKAKGIIIPLAEQGIPKAYCLAALVASYNEDIVKANHYLSLAVNVLKGKELGEAYWIIGNISFNQTDFNQLIKTNFAPIIDSYKNAIKNGYYDAYYELGEIQYWQGKTSEAKSHYTNALGFVTDSRLINTYHALSDIALEENDILAATNYLIEAGKLGDMSAVFHIGLIYKNRLDEALAFFKPKINIDNLYAVILGRIYVENDDQKNAVLCFNIGLHNGYKYALYEVGKLYEKRNDLTKASDYYLQATKFEIPYAYNRLGVLAQNDKKYKSAYTYYDKSVNMNNPEGVMHIASLYAIINKLEKSIQFYNHAIEIVDHKELKKVYFNLGIVYSKIKVVDKAIAMFLKAHWYKNPTAIYNLILIYIKLNKTEEALNYGAIIIKRIKMMDEKLCQMVMGDDYVNVIYTIGTFYYNCRKYDEALELLTKFPETIKPERWLENGNRFFLIGQHDVAANLYNHAIEKFAPNECADVASQFLKINKIDIAFDFYKKIIQKIDPNDQVNAIELFINAKEFDKAFTFASQIGPSFDAKAGIRVTSAFYKSSQIKMAIDFYHIVFSKLAIAEKISFANLFFESGDKVTAHQLYIECLGQAQKEDAIFIISRLGSIYYESSNWNEVITAYEKIINFVDTATLKYIGWYLGISYLRVNQEEKSLQFANLYYPMFPSGFENAGALYKKWAEEAHVDLKQKSAITISNSDKDIVAQSKFDDSLKKNSIST